MKDASRAAGRGAPAAPRADPLVRARWPALLAAACWTGLASYFSTAGNDITLFAWIAPVPILAFAFARGAAARGGDPASGAQWRLGAAAFVGALGGNLAWVVLYRGILPLAAVGVSVVLLAVAFAGVVMAAAFVAARLGSFAATCAFPALWVTVEFALARLSPHGTAGSVAYSQVDLLPLVQLAAWTGLSGIVFVVFLVAGSLGALFGDRRSGWRPELLVAPVLVLVGVIVVGQWRISAMPGRRHVLVGLASIDSGMRHFSSTARDEALPVVSSYLESAGSLAAHGAEAVVLPEKMIGVAPEYEDEVSSLLSSLAERDEIILVAGLNKVGRDRRRNVAVVYTRGRRVLEYDKQHLVPGFEDGYARGATPGLYRAPGGMVGVAICKDLDFPSLGRAYGEAGIGLLFVPAWDFGRDARVHSRMAVMRGVEGGYSVARAAANGLLTGSDPLGRIVTERASGSASRALLLADLPLGPGNTFYARHGDYFAWLNVAASGFLLLAAFMRRGRG